MNRLVRKYKLTLGLGQDALTDQVAGGYSGRSFHVVVEPIRCHGQLLSIETYQPLLSEMLIHQPP